MERSKPQDGQPLVIEQDGEPGMASLQKLSRATRVSLAIVHRT